MPILVDGYNFIFGARLMENHLEDAREKCLDLLKEFSLKSKQAVCVVFDSTQNHLYEEKHLNDYLEIIFTQEDSSADEHILYLLQYEFDPKQSTVISNDKNLIRLCRCLGAHSQTIQKFFKKVNKTILKEDLSQNTKQDSFSRYTAKQKNLEEKSPDFDYYLAAFEKRMEEKEEI